MRLERVLLGLLLGLPVAATPACSSASDAAQGSAQEAASALALVSDLVVTEGSIQRESAGHFHVEDDAVRAVAGTDAAPLAARIASLEATYRGVTSTTSTLGSGAIRTQYGLKLLHKDPCNLVYAMVRVAGGQGRLVVQTKLNDGASTSADCGNGGYADVGALDLGAIAAGERHTLRSTWNPGRRTLTIDFDHGAPLVVTLAADVVLRLGNGVGVRSDNAVWDFELATSL